ncbi:NAD-dependent epimerase/dehydratase family protein [Actinomycetes bacterium KLBMP 9797]
MRLLVIGGTWFVGRAVVETAASVGHEVTVFNRGRTNVEPPGGVRRIRGDRERVDDLQMLAAAGTWEAVIDVPGVVPAVVRDAARSLAPVVERYVFVSTVSVYRDWPKLPVSERSPLHPADADARPDEWVWGTGVYGPLKAGAEAAVRREVGADRATIVRPGVVLGPHEYGGRLTWWLQRAERGGRILAPGSPAHPIRPIDVRDLAAFIVKLVEEGATGEYNAAGPPGRDTFGRFLGMCLDATGGDGELSWVDDHWLQTQGVRQWVELPLWRMAPGTWAIDTAKAQAVGLSCRSLEQTVRDTWTWMRSGGRPVELERHHLHGIGPKREAALLATWDKEVRSQPAVLTDPNGQGTQP